MTSSISPSLHDDPSTERPPRGRRTAAWVAAPVVLAGAVTAGAAAQPATAALTPTVWTHAASTCTPDEASTGRYDVHVGDFKHKGSATGQIVTRCNVVNLPQYGAGDANAMEVVYRDQDASGNSQRVVVSLIRANDNGTTTIVRTFDSNLFPGGTATRKATLAYSHNFDFGRNAYYVDIRVSRTTPTIYPIATLVRLTGVIL